MYGICNLSSVPLRVAPSDKAEMISQVLFGESFQVLEKDKYWSKIKISFDGYQGYIDNKQFEFIPEKLFTQIARQDIVCAGEYIDFITDISNNVLTIPLGANLPFYENHKFNLNFKEYQYSGNVFTGKLPKNELIRKAFTYLNTPFLWGGKTPFGIDCSGFTQMVYKLCGHQLYRDTHQQAQQGEVLSFIEESEPGDLAFFDDDEGTIIHVGIILKDYNIIHAHGKVRVDTLDHSGIFNHDIQTHTHRLRIIKKMI